MGAHEGPWSPMGAHGPTGFTCPVGYWGGGPLAESLRCRKGIAPRNRYFKELKLPCRECKNSLTSEKGVLCYSSCSGCACNSTAQAPYIVQLGARKHHYLLHLNQFASKWNALYWTGATLRSEIHCIYCTGAALRSKAHVFYCTGAHWTESHGALESSCSSVQVFENTFYLLHLSRTH